MLGNFLLVTVCRVVTGRVFDSNTKVSQNVRPEAKKTIANVLETDS